MMLSTEVTDEINRKSEELESLFQRREALTKKLSADAAELNHVHGRIFLLRWQIDRMQKTGEMPIDPRDQLGFDDDAIHDDDYQPPAYEMH